MGRSPREASLPYEQPTNQTNQHLQDACGLS
jgi:hypothetical protein